MAASPSEPGQRSWSEAFRALSASERLAAIAALACAGSLVLPWYSAPVEHLVKTGFGAFGFAKAALLLTDGAALVMLLEVGRGRRPPMPLHEGTLLTAAGVWTGLIVVYLMLDRPEFDLRGFREEYELGYGVFVALGGAALLALAGIRVRRVEALRGKRR
ncbi:MAG: hypothetical protein AABM29_03735 [Actinomycetota bacterium]